MKRAIQPVDVSDVLAKVDRLPISTWRYMSEPDAVRHIGPMAQDFRQMFGLGDGDRVYHAVDAHGVSFAAIQALSKLVDIERQRTRALERQNRALERRLEALEGRGPTR